MCIALVQTVLQAARKQGLILQPQAIKDLQYHRLLKVQAAQVSSGLQPRKKVPHLIPDVPATATFVTGSLLKIPCNLLQKLPKAIELNTCANLPVHVPAASRFLRFAPFKAPEGGGSEASTGGEGTLSNSRFKVVCGLPWSRDSFIQQACKSGRPPLQDHQIPPDLKVAVEKNLEWDDAI